MAADEQGSCAGTTATPGLVLATYATAIFLSAALLFAVQPLFTKMVLPRLGGSPSVWSVAMVFFQGVLLAGYAYAHALTRFLPGRIAVTVHVAVLIVATFALPLAVATGWSASPDHGEAFWLMALFAVSIGLPFFALSANGPLLQAWFARSSHPDAGQPYFLYAVSNVGSLLALLSYPFVLEPLTTLREQNRMWSAGFYGLIVLVALCGFMALRARGSDSRPFDVQPADSQPGDEGIAAAAPTWRDAATWMALAAVPAGLLIAVTAHLSTDVAAAPLLWVIPLALYLLTFVIVFQTKPLLRHDWMVAIQPLFIAGLVVLLAFEVLHHIFLSTAGNIAAFFVTALVCHGELARRRPAPRHLTAFYMWMSAGGVVGGIAAGLVAPRVFSWVAEYPLLIVLAILCRPGPARPVSRHWRAVWLVVLAAAVAAMLLGLGYQYGLQEKAFKPAIAGLLVISILFWRDPVKFAAVIAVAFMAARLHDPGVGRREFVRSFFGVYKIIDSADGMFRIFLHGTTEHGAQRLERDDGSPIGRPETLTYYHLGSPLAQATAAVRKRKDAPIRIAVVGLGTGTFACLTGPGDVLHFYEIDRVVAGIATDPTRFSYVSRCAPEARIVLGDARLTLAAADDGQYDVIVMDAFSSDAIPVHLMTQEAMAIYLKKLAPGGLVLMHISNRHMELASVVANIAAANGAVTRLSDSDTGEDDDNYKFSSTVAAVARSEPEFAALAGSEDWQPTPPDPSLRTWTDDYSNIIGAMIRHAR
jgi:hypothetical protein